MRPVGCAGVRTWERVRLRATSAKGSQVKAAKDSPTVGEVCSRKTLLLVYLPAVTLADRRAAAARRREHQCRADDVSAAVTGKPLTRSPASQLRLGGLLLAGTGAGRRS